jgi:hypothetical protein
VTDPILFNKSNRVQVAEFSPRMLYGNLNVEEFAGKSPSLAPDCEKIELPPMRLIRHRNGKRTFEDLVPEAAASGG